MMMTQVAALETLQTNIPESRVVDPVSPRQPEAISIISRSNPVALALC